MEQSLLNRRRFVQSVFAASFAPASGSSCANPGPGGGALSPDPQRLLDLPPGFELTVVSRAGTSMDDGFSVPPAHDGMAAFAGANGRVVLVCNHETAAGETRGSAFGRDLSDLPDAIRKRFYDWGEGLTPGAGGTTSTVYDPATRQTEHQCLTLAGTEVNCAGGKTPWGSWLSCEECFESPGTRLQTGRHVIREKKHGYVFEVAADAESLVHPVPLVGLGRFEHEAAAVHERTGIVYMTEDRYHSLFYRFLPAVPGKLVEGGRLQALSIAKQPSFRTHNWGRSPDIRLKRALPVRWIDLEGPDRDENDLRLSGAACGAATFARGEGLCVAGERLFFTCTIGGFARRGQVFGYRPSPFEGTSREVASPGKLELLAEAEPGSLLANADNLTMAPWGDLIVCEDTESHCGLVGIRPDGSQYALADNAYSDSELAGVCFSPDGKSLFVNIQYPGMTVAITGPWPGRVVRHAAP